MKKICLLLLGMFFILPVYAENCLEPMLNKVTMQLKAEQWLTTKTALVNVLVNAAISDQNIVQVQNDVMKKLSPFSSKAEWHILSFNRQQDRSGLESIQIVAQARLAQNELSNLRDKAKAISKPGETYTIDNVQFIPSEEEIRAANKDLRAVIYQQTKTEIDALNAAYPNQKYYLHQIDFMTLAPMPVQAMAMVQSGNAIRTSSSGISVGNKLELQAAVVLAALPEALPK